MVYKSLRNIVLVLSAIASAAACGGTDEASAGLAMREAVSATLSDGEAPRGVTAQSITAGQTLFNGRAACAGCHGLNGTGGQLAPGLSDDEWLNSDGSYAGIIEVINSGVLQPREYPGLMLPRGGMRLSDAQVSALAAFIWSLSIRG